MPWGGQAQPKGRRPGGCGWVPVPTCEPEPARTERDLIPRPCRAGCTGPTPQGPPLGEETRPWPRPHPALVTRPPLLPGGAGSGPTCPHADSLTWEPREDTVGSRDREPGGARAGEWGDQPCLVCVAEGRPRGLGGGRPGGGTGGGAQEGGHAQLLLLPCALLPSRKCRGLSPRDAGQASPRFWEPPPRRLGEQECALAPAQACLAPQRPTGGPTHPPRPGTACFLEEVALGLACGQTRGRPEARIHWGPALGLGGGAGAG